MRSVSWPEADVREQLPAAAGDAEEGWVSEGRWTAKTGAEGTSDPWEDGHLGASVPSENGPHKGLGGPHGGLHWAGWWACSQCPGRHTVGLQSLLCPGRVRSWGTTRLGARFCPRGGWRTKVRMDLKKMKKWLALTIC